MEEIHCTLMDVLHLTGQRPHHGDQVQLHNKPGREHHGRHSDRHVQFPCRLMWGNGVMRAVMVTTLTNPRTEDGRTTHSVKKFVVPEYIIELLGGLPLSIRFGINGYSSVYIFCHLKGSYLCFKLFQKAAHKSMMHKGQDEDNCFNCSTCLL